MKSLFKDEPSEVHFRDIELKEKDCLTNRLTNRLAYGVTGTRLICDFPSHHPPILGRDLFNFRPELMLGDDAEADDMTYEREDSDDEAEEGEENGAAKASVKEIDLDTFAFDMDKVGTRHSQSTFLFCISLPPPCLLSATSHFFL